MSHTETTHLIGQAKRGEQGAFDALFARCVPRLLPYVHSRSAGRLHWQLESQDILQKTLLKAFVAFPSFQGATASELLGWLREIATNTVNDHEMEAVKAAAPADNRRRSAVPVSPFVIYGLCQGCSSST